MKKIVIGVASVALAMSAGAFAANVKLGVVSVQQVFKQAPQGQATLEQLKDNLQPQINKLKKRQAQLADQVKDLERNAPTMSKSAKQKQEKQLASEQQSFQKDVLTLRRSELKKEQAAANTFQADLQKSISQVGKSGGYDMILLKQAAPYYNNSYDVTGQVVANMKKMS